jgi:hypothetical protein
MFLICGTFIARLMMAGINDMGDRDGWCSEGLKKLFQREELSSDN